MHCHCDFELGSAARTMTSSTQVLSASVASALQGLVTALHARCSPSVARCRSCFECFLWRTVWMHCVVRWEGVGCGERETCRRSKLPSESRVTRVASSTAVGVLPARSTCVRAQLAACLCLRVAVLRHCCASVARRWYVCAPACCSARAAHQVCSNRVGQHWMCARAARSHATAP